MKPNIPPAGDLFLAWAGCVYFVWLSNGEARQYYIDPFVHSMSEAHLDAVREVAQKAVLAGEHPRKAIDEAR